MAAAPSHATDDARPGDAVALRISLFIPSESVGLLIGRGGETVKAIQATASVRVIIDQQPPPDKAAQDRSSPYRRVQLVGTKPALELAESMVRTVLADFEVFASATPPSAETQSLAEDTVMKLQQRLLEAGDDGGDEPLVELSAEEMVALQQMGLVALEDLESAEAGYSGEGEEMNMEDVEVVRAEDRLSMYYCDGCERRLSVDEQRYTCQVCEEIDLCKGCSAQGAGAPPLGDHTWDHPLEAVDILEEEMFESALSSFFCDACMHRFYVGESVMHCVECEDMDLCEACVGSEMCPDQHSSQHRLEVRMATLDESPHALESLPVEPFAFTELCTRAEWQLGGTSAAGEPLPVDQRKERLQTLVQDMSLGLTAEQRRSLALLGDGLFDVLQPEGTRAPATHSLGLTYLFEQPEVLIIDRDGVLPTAEHLTILTNLAARWQLTSGAPIQRLNDIPLGHLLEFGLDGDQMVDVISRGSFVPVDEATAAEFLEQLSWFTTTIAGEAHLACRVCELVLDHEPTITE